MSLWAKKIISRRHLCISLPPSLHPRAPFSIICFCAQLAQRKRVIVLDEPFVGLDPEAAGAVAQELLRLRRDLGTALLLVSHE